MLHEALANYLETVEQAVLETEGIDIERYIEEENVCRFRRLDMTIVRSQTSRSKDSLQTSRKQVCLCGLIK